MASATKLNRGSVKRGAIALAAVLALCACGPPVAEADFAIRQADLSFSEVDGSPVAQAGSHPFAATATVLLDGGGTQADSLQDLRIVFPPGLVGTFDSLPECSPRRLGEKDCPAAAAVGVLQLLTSIEAADGPVPILVQEPVYNLGPEVGTVAQLGVSVGPPESSVEMRIQLGVAAGPQPSAYASLAGVPQEFPASGVRLVLWGDPADPAHDAFRGQCGRVYMPGREAFETLSSGSCPLPPGPRLPVLSMPSSCAAAASRFEATSWASAHSVVTVEEPPLGGCANLPFDVAAGASVTSRNASSPSGLAFWLDARNDGLQTLDQLASASIAGVALRLPPGMAINPAAAIGRAYCSPQQLSAEALDASTGSGCPQSSRIGSAVATTFLFEGSVAGSVYLAEPEKPFEGRLTLDLVLRDPELGLVVVQAIEVVADPRTGQLTATASGIPQLPLRHLELRLDASEAGPLATPRGCGTHTFSTSLEPSSGNPPTIASQPFALADNCPEASRPRLSADLSSSAAGSATRLAAQLSISSYEASPTAIVLKLPKGMAANFRGVPLCPEASAPSAACSPESRLGSVRVAVGAGSKPLWMPAASGPGGDVFLAGPYRGAPFSLLLELPARAGPFDLGRVVLRAPVSIDPITAQARIRVEGIPQILSGIPLRYREVRLVLDRPGFLRNPTSCAPSAIAGIAADDGGGSAHVSAPLRATGCKMLPFSPGLSLRLSGALARNGHPAVRAVVGVRPGEANIATAAITLPRGELLDLRHIGGLCARRLAPRRCPAGSKLGYARLWSPLLGSPLEGAIYLRTPTSGFPDLLADLHAGQIHIVLHGRTASTAGRLSVRLQTLPDLPLSRAIIELGGGRRGILVNSEAQCGRRRRAEGLLTAHSGKRRRIRPRLLLYGSC